MTTDSLETKTDTATRYCSKQRHSCMSIIVLACTIVMLVLLCTRTHTASQTAREEIQAIRDYDPSVTSDAQVAFTYSGLHAVWLHRLAHRLWIHNHKFCAQLISQLARILTGVEIHPGARIGKRLIIDHGAGTVIGETAVIGDDVVIYQGVTLGSVDNHGMLRHPHIGNRVLIGAGAAILGHVRVGDDARIGAHAVVLDDVPCHETAVGVPARIVGKGNTGHR